MCIASSTKLVKPNDDNNSWPLFLMWLNVAATLVGFILVRKALNNESQKSLKNLGCWILDTICLQLFANLRMLGNLTNLNGIAKFAQTEIFMLSYVVVFLVFAGYQLLIVLHAKRPAKPLKPEQIA